MGLDSVELLMSFEKYFEIEVSDLEAEKIRSVEEMVDCVARHLKISNQKTPLKSSIFKKLESILIQEKLVDNSLSLSDTIFSIIDPDDRELWEKLSKELELQIPVPFRGADTFFKNLLFSGWHPNYDWKKITTDQFITAICAYNYEKLIDPKSIKNTYEILIAITAITSDNIGVDLYEVEPHKRFVDDLGID